MSQPGLRHGLPRQPDPDPDPDALRRIGHKEFITLAGSEGVELIMWLVMRGALGKGARELHRFYHVPASNTAVGHMVLAPA
ncbi:MAG TPA: hypothetical protein VIJ94_08105 [Caulobacteraceae bacterium]